MLTGNPLYRVSSNAFGAAGKTFVNDGVLIELPPGGVTVFAVNPLDAFFKVVVVSVTLAAVSVVVCWE